MNFCFHWHRKGENYIMEAPKAKDISKMIEKITIKNSNTLKYTAGRTASRYIVREDGIMEEWDELDQNGEVINTIGKMVLSKKLFVMAYNAYIKDER